jgi:hypothetical protein
MWCNVARRRIDDDDERHQLSFLGYQPHATGAASTSDTARLNKPCSLGTLQGRHAPRKGVDAVIGGSHLDASRKIGHALG